MAARPSDLDLWWLAPRVIAGMPAPFVHPERRQAGEAPLRAFPDELPELWDAGVRAIVCLLNMPNAAPTFRSAGFAWECIPVPDMNPPTMPQFVKFLEFTLGQLAKRQAVAVHCAAGIGRTGVFLAGLLVAAGLKPEAALKRVRAVRPGAVETSGQYAFLLEVAAQRISLPPAFGKVLGV